jgi:hypothetical protein
MTDDPAQLAEHLEQIAAMVRRLPAASDWIDAYLSGEILLTDQAAEIAATSTETIRRRCEATASTSRPLGVLIAGSVWLVSRSGLLGWIEAHEGGAPAMLAARSRAEKLAEMRSSPQQSLRRRVAATG